MIKFAGFAKGTSRTFARLRGSAPSNAVGPKNGPSRVLDIGDDAPIEIGETRTGETRQRRRRRA